MKVLDLFCGAGGAAWGLHQAWPEAEIVGVDSVFQPHYPFRFVCGDAMTYPLEGFDFVWARPPCQGYSVTATLPGRSAANYPRLIGPVRERLTAWGGDWVIENVQGAPMEHEITLCGLPFGLRVYRHRQFEASQMLLAPAHLRHRERIATKLAASYVKDVGAMVTVAGHLFGLEAGARAMGIHWMSRAELAQAVPPAYSRYIAEQYGDLR